MANRPIIFSAPMIRAMRDGLKTQTRRVSGLRDVNLRPGEWTLNNVGPLGYMAKKSAKGKFGATFESRAIEAGTLSICPQRLPYAPGDRLWVREAFADSIAGNGLIYKADVPFKPLQIATWKPSIHMPRWASRLTLTVTDVRVQRLQDISEADAVAEGCGWSEMWEGFTPCPQSGDGRYFSTRSAQRSFEQLWAGINGPDAWAANPWVCAITFDVAQGNIDNLPGAANA